MKIKEKEKEEGEQGREKSNNSTIMFKENLQGSVHKTTGIWQKPTYRNAHVPKNCPIETDTKKQTEKKEQKKVSLS